MQYEEFLAPFLELVQSFAPEDPKTPTPSEYSLIQSLQDPERSNCIVVVRLLPHRSGLVADFRLGTPTRHIIIHPKPHRPLLPLPAIPRNLSPIDTRRFLPTRS